MKTLDDELFDIYCQDDKTVIGSLREIYEKGRADREKELAELPNEYSENLWKKAYDRGYQQGKADAITECLRIVQKIKDDYKEARFGEQIPINYGTLCGIIIAFEQLKEQKEGAK